MDPELKQYLDAKFAELDGKFAELDGKFATKQDLARLEGWLRDEFKRQASQQDLDRLATKDGIEKVETTLLTEFHKWASPIENRVRSYASLLHAHELDVEWLKERVKKLEDRAS